jgi:hypothetical protein
MRVGQKFQDNCSVLIVTMDFLKTFWIGNLVMMVPWTMLLLGIRWTGICLYHIRNREKARRFQKRISQHCTYFVDGNLGGGYAIGKYFVAHVNIQASDYGDTYDVWVLCGHSVFETLTAPLATDSSDAFSNDSDTAESESFEDTETTPPKPSTIVILDRLGTYCSVFFRSRSITLTRLQPRENQKEIMTKVLYFYKKHGHAVVYLHGPPGAGKSVMGLLLAKELGASFCNTLKPWQPGDTLGELYYDVEPTADKPLVLVLDEFDEALVQFPIPPHHKIPIAVPDKAGWNRMMDEVHWGLFPHLVLVLTSNRPPEFIRELDPSYIREGRVDVTEAME